MYVVNTNLVHHGMVCTLGNSMIHTACNLYRTVDHHSIRKSDSDRAKPAVSHDNGKYHASFKGGWQGQQSIVLPLTTGLNAQAKTKIKTQLTRRPQ